jgi:RNA polymerase sigma-70 factor (ECF subfamily)
LGSAPTSTSEADLETYRVELTGYCYRMMGSIFEAEDAVQETMIRAWRNLASFEGRSSLRSWMYRIATNVCLTALTATERKRVRPVDFGPSSFAELPIGPKRPEIPWIEPAPDRMVLPGNVDPAELAVQRESVRLAFIAALQNLPPKQRAAMILCEVLRWKAEEAAELLETSEAAINSALQRARATIEGLDLVDQKVDLTEDKHQLARKYAESFEAYDMDALTSLLRDEVVMSMPPYDLWLVGPAEVRTWMLGHGKGCKDSAVVLTEANGTVAYGQYRRNEQGEFHPWALGVLDVDNNQISAITSFLDVPKLFPLFGLPLQVDSQNFIAAGR